MERDDRGRAAARAIPAAVVLPLFGLALASITCCAQEQLAPTKLSLRDALVTALDSNPKLKSAQKDHLNAVAQTRIAELATSFSVGGSATAAHSPDQSSRSGRLFGSATYMNLFGTEATLNISPLASGEERGSVGFSLSHPLMKRKGVLSEKSDQVLSARSNAVVRERDVFLQKQAIVQDVIDNYFRAVQAREQVKVQESALAIAEKTAEIARKREEAGLDRGLDVVRAEATVAENRDALNLEKQSARGAIDRLMVAIGSGVGQTPELTDEVPETADSDLTLTQAIETALKNRSEFFVFDQQIDTQTRKLAIAKEDLKPSLEFMTQFRSSERDGGALSTNLFSEGYFDAGLVYRFPIDRRAATERLSSEARDLDILSKLRAFQTEQVVEQVRQAYREMDAARTSLDINTRNLKIAEDRLRLAERMVEEGEGTNREVLDAQDGLTRVKSSIISAKANLYLANINLKYYMGEDLTTLVAK